MIDGNKRFDSYFDDYMRLWTVSDNENDNMLYPCTSESMANEFTKLLNELNDENKELKETLAFRSNQLALMERLIDDLGSDEMARQMEEILND